MTHAPYARQYRRQPPSYLRRMLYSPQHSAPRNGIRDALAAAGDAMAELWARWRAAVNA